MADPRAGAEDAAFRKWYYSLPHVSMPDHFLEGDRRRAYIAFAAGFAAALAYATPAEPSTTAPDPATVARMENLLWAVVTGVDDDFDGFSSVRMDILRFFGRDPDTEDWPTVRERADDTHE